MPSDVVPWLDAPATAAELAAQTRPVPNPPVTGPACQVSNLRLVPDDEGGDGASGHLFYSAEVRNAGSNRCVLEGYPTVTATVDGRVQTLALDRHTYMGLDEAVKVSLAPGAEAVAVLDLHERADDCPGVHQPTLQAVSVALGSQRVEVIPKALDYCQLSEGAWRSAADPFDEPKAAIHDQLRGVTARVEGASRTARAGDLVTYDVALTNHTTHPIALTPCPIYEVGGLSGDHFYRLNCAAQSTLPAGVTVRFAMPAFRLPADWPSDGRALKLGWLIPGSDIFATPATGGG